jgi:predicted nucleic acid-binding protein
MIKPSIVIDTNVLVSALRSKRGASYQLLSLIDSGKFSFFLSVPLVLEYEVTAARIERFIDYFCQQGQRREIFFLWRGFLSDPKDDMVLEIAVTGGCRYIVTFNISDFHGVNKFGISPIRPQEFLKKIGGLS